MWQAQEFHSDLSCSLLFWHVSWLWHSVVFAEVKLLFCRSCLCLVMIQYDEGCLMVIIEAVLRGCCCFRLTDDPAFWWSESEWHFNFSDCQNKARHDVEIVKCQGRSVDVCCTGLTQRKQSSWKPLCVNANAFLIVVVFTHQWTSRKCDVSWYRWYRSGIITLLFFGS